MDYLDWIIWKAVALCALAFCWGFYKRIIETRPPAPPESPWPQQSSAGSSGRAIANDQ